LPLNKTRAGYMYLDGQGAQSDLTIAAGATDSSGSTSIDTQGFKIMGIQLIAKGAAAGSAGNITFNVITSTDGTNFEDSGHVTAYTLALNGTAEVRNSINLDVQFIRSIKILTIVNGDAGNAINTVNVHYYMEEYV